MEHTAQTVIDGEDASHQPVPLGFRRLLIVG
jgi:hypothetical protein